MPVIKKAEPKEIKPKREKPDKDKVKDWLKAHDHIAIDVDAKVWNSETPASICELHDIPTEELQRVIGQ